MTLPYAMIIGLDYKQTVIAVLLGGIGGFLFFYYLSKPFVRVLDSAWPHICKMLPLSAKAKFQTFCAKKSINLPPKIFTRKSRNIAKFKRTYGFWGIVLTTPLFLSIPLGAFLANKYYSRRKHTVLYMILSIIGWTIVFSGFVLVFPNVLR